MKTSPIYSDCNQAKSGVKKTIKRRTLSEVLVSDVGSDQRQPPVARYGENQLHVLPAEDGPEGPQDQHQISVDD